MGRSLGQHAKTCITNPTSFTSPPRLDKPKRNVTSHTKLQTAIPQTDQQYKTTYKITYPYKTVTYLLIYT